MSAVNTADAVLASGAKVYKLRFDNGFFSRLITAFEVTIPATAKADTFIWFTAAFLPFGNCMAKAFIDRAE